MSNDGGEVIQFPQPPSSEEEQVIRDMLLRAADAAEAERRKRMMQETRSRHPSAHKPGHSDKADHRLRLVVDEEEPDEPPLA